VLLGEPEELDEAGVGRVGKDGDAERERHGAQSTADVEV
jgi:hypothetical protein